MSEVVMPRLGWTMETGQVVEWFKQDGEAVEAGEIIFSVESDKAVTDVEALDSGILRIPPDSPLGVEVPVGTMLAYVVLPGEPAPFERGAAVVVAAPSVRVSEAPAFVTNGASGRGDRDGRPTISPRARRRATALGLDWTVLSGSGSTGRIRERDVLAAVALGAPPVAPPRATPIVRRLAEEQEVDLGRLAARASGRRISRADVRDAAVSQVRRIIGQRMAESAHTTAPVTLTTEADATELSRIRGHLKAELAGMDGPLPLFTDLIARLVALALLEHPALNASLVDSRIVLHDAVHLGIATDTDRGLLVPVVRDAHDRSVQQIATESARLVEQARAGSIAADDLRGGTFTITNLGMHEIDAFTPIINLPECAILGLGRIVPRPVVIDEDAETVAVRKMMALSLTFDHRVVDGAPAARFLKRVKGMIERPYAWLLR